MGILHFAFCILHLSLPHPPHRQRRQHRTHKLQHPRFFHHSFHPFKSSPPQAPSGAFTPSPHKLPLKSPTSQILALQPPRLTHALDVAALAPQVAPCGWPLASCPERPHAPVLCRLTNSYIPRTSRTSHVPLDINSAGVELGANQEDLAVVVLVRFRLPLPESSSF
jgi:hypothetical protein